jgi:hypothetical protein
MTTTSDTIRELRAAVQVGDESLEAERRSFTTTIRERLAAASAWPWMLVDQRLHSPRGQVQIHRASRTAPLIARVLRSGVNPGHDADLIAHAPADLAYLLDEVDRLRGERDVLLQHATDEGRTAYWRVRSTHRQQEVDARKARKDNP